MQSARPRLRCLAAAALVASALGVGSAEAAPFTPRLNLAYDLALGYWKAEPPNCSSIDRQIVPAGWLQRKWPPELYPDPRLADGAARATLPPPDAVVPCILYFDRRLARPSTSFARLCAVAVHEVGHLQGLAHNDNTASVMYAGYLVTPRFCRLAARLYSDIGIARWYLLAARVYCRDKPSRSCWRSVRGERTRLRHLLRRLAALR